MDEYALLRRRETEERLDLARSSEGQLVGNPAFTGIVYNGGSMPTSLPAIFFTNPVKFSGDQTEGGMPTPIPNTRYTVPVAVFGPRVPDVAEILEAYYIDGRWCAYVGGSSSGGGGGGTVTIPGCICTASPVTISMTVVNPGLNNMIFNSCTIVYGPTPSALLPVVLTANSWLSTASFFDPVLGVNFQYYLQCAITAFKLTRVYVVTPFEPGPFRDQIRYSWTPGFPPNTCTPFSLTNGQIFLGGDNRTTCALTG